MPGSRAAGWARGMGWFWGGWEGDRGWFIARIGLPALREGRGCWCVWDTAGSHWDLAGMGKGKHHSPCPVGDTAARDRLMLGCDILLQSGPRRFYPWTHQSLPLMPGGPFCHVLTCCQPQDGAGCGATLLKIISTKGPLGHSAALSHAMGEDIELHYIPWTHSLPPSKCSSHSSVSIILHAKQILTYTFFFFLIFAHIFYFAKFKLILVWSACILLIWEY